MWLTNHSSKWLCWQDSLKVSTQYVKMRQYVNSRGNPFIKCEDGDVHENVVKNVNSRFFHLFSVLFQISDYLKCKGTLLELNSWRALSTFRKRKKIFSLLEIRYFQVVAVQRRHDARAEFVVSLIICGHTRRLRQGSPWGNSLGWVRCRFWSFVVCGHTTIHCPRGWAALDFYWPKEITSGAVIGNSIVLLDASMEISLRQFHLGEIGHTQKVASPKATAICSWVNR